MEHDWPNGPGAHSLDYGEKKRLRRYIYLCSCHLRSEDVPNNVSTVLEVLGKRTRDLEAQQRQILKRHL